jgi:hypothetical protein
VTELQEGDCHSIFLFIFWQFTMGVEKAWEFLFHHNMLFISLGDNSTGK